MSYMKVVAYTHSPDSATVLYGFANMFVLGFLWAAPGGTGCALPAYLSREKLTELFHPYRPWCSVGWPRTFSPTSSDFCGFRESAS